jgi:hypothetical protein
MSAGVANHRNDSTKTWQEIQENQAFQSPVKSRSLRGFDKVDEAKGFSPSEFNRGECTKEFVKHISQPTIGM